nr:hypothetical protein [Tanacetum cinerariifolium]
MVPPNNLGLDLNGKFVNETQYIGMIGSLMYLTASRPDIQFSTCLCARYQANPKESRHIDVNLKGTLGLGIWKSTSGACLLLGDKLVCWSAKKQQSVAMSSVEAKYVATARWKHLLDLQTSAEFWYSGKAFKNSKVLFSTLTGEVRFEDTEVFKEIKLEDLSMLVQNAQADFMDLDSTEDDPIIVVDDSEEDDEEHKYKEVYATLNVETEDTLAPKPPFLSQTNIPKCETEVELGIDLDKPLSEQDPLDKLNDLENTKRKHVDDIHDYFRANKRLKSSVQHKDHPAGTVLNKPVMDMIMLNSYYMHDFITIEDFREFLNEILRTTQEIFFRLYQGHSLNNHARTFSALFLAEVDKRNLNPLKQMRPIK